MATKNHVHKYRLIKIGKNKLYACSLPDCSHHIPAHLRKTVIGKASICWECDEKMIMSRDIVRKNTVKPRCWKCRGKNNPSLGKPIVEQERQEMDAAVDMLLRMRLGGEK